MTLTDAQSVLARTDQSGPPGRRVKDIWMSIVKKYANKVASNWLVSCAALCVLDSIGCANSATDLRPREVASGHAAIFGRVEIINDGWRLTEQCKIVFSDEDKHAKAIMTLDETGWVFSSVATGPTYLSYVICRVSAGQVGHVEYSTRRLAFQAPGNGRIVYFGDVRIDMQTATSEPGEGYLPPRTAAQIAQRRPGGPPGDPTSAPAPGSDIFAAVVQKRFEEAVREYQRRYGADAQALNPEASIAGASPGSVGVLTNAPNPMLALGFALGQGPADAEARCKGAGLVWHQLDGGAFSCSGSPVDLGVPVTVKLAACAEKICEVEANLSADGALWSVLVKRFGLFTGRLARDHGDKHQRAIHPLAGCALGDSDCAGSGRVFKSETWRWPNKQRVTLELDGGPSGGAPSLRVFYRTGASFERTP